MLQDGFDFLRFIEAQDRVYASVLDELRAGDKRSHWMWFIFPQIKGLGTSHTAQAFAISSCEEARAYAEHPTLGARLRECTALVMNVEGRTAEEIFHYPDYLKFRSSMTLFGQCAADGALFHDALVKYFDGESDERTLDLLARR